MKDIELPPFFIGQRVVQLVDGSQTKSKRGDVFAVLGVKKLPCGCWVIDIGLASIFPFSRCDIHFLNRIENNGVHWVGAKFYAPIEDYFEEISFEEVIAVEKKLTCAN